MSLGCLNKASKVYSFKELPDGVKSLSGS
jgi:hypothetical protein